MGPAQHISRRAFAELQEVFKQGSGIVLKEDKQSLVESRLQRRLEALSLDTFDDYCAYLREDASGRERQRAIDLLTTNETYFFREPSHFEQLGKALDDRFKGRSVRIWSAACSTGEEPYSIAMTMLDRRGDSSWELRASDLSTRVIEIARRGVFPMNRIEHMPATYLKRFCMRGTGEYDGMLRVAPEVLRSVQFFQHNLLHDARPLGTFEVIFVRNVLIYFDEARKRDILERLVGRLVQGGLLFIGHAEPLHGHGLPLRKVDRALFEKL
jgi:chemotaxis protein methyltransferase CheR